MNRKLMKYLIALCPLPLLLPTSGVAQQATTTPDQSSTNNTVASASTGPAVAPQTAEELDALVAPIALYPDALVAQVLGACAAPDQVAIAAYWLGQNKSLTGTALAQAVDAQTWDPSVKALTQFPSVLNDLAGNLAWTSSLGQAFQNQQSDVMAAVQAMRAKAQAAGTLQTTAQVKVVQSAPQTIVIQPANPNVVYVPQYNPTVVYGAPVVVPLYRPAVVVATPVVAYGPAISVGIGFGGGGGFVGGGFSWGWNSWNCNWGGGGGGGNVVYQHNTYIHNTTYINNHTTYNNYHPWGPVPHGPGPNGPHPYNPNGVPNGGRNGNHGLIGGNGGTQHMIGGNGGTQHMIGGNGGTQHMIGGNGGTQHMIGGNGGTQHPIGGDGGTQHSIGGDGGTQHPIGGDGGVQRPDNNRQPADANRARGDASPGADPHGNGFGANQPRSQFSGNGDAARAEGNRGRASMHPAASHPQTRRAPAPHPQPQRGGRGRR